MGHYIYDESGRIKSEVIRGEAGAKTAEEYLSHKSFNGPVYVKEEKDLPTCVNKFFNHPHIRQLVEENDWNEIFKCWQNDYSNLNSAARNRDKFYGNKPGWGIIPLVIFLALANIEFWKYIDRTPLFESWIPIEWVDD